MRVDVELSRCVCIHSLSQVVDIALQVLLYQRQIIPEPVQFLLSSEGGPKVEKFRSAYNEVKKVICQSFRHHNSLCLKEFVIVIGSTPYLPKEIYRIPVAICLRHLIGVNCNQTKLQSKENKRPDKCKSGTDESDDDNKSLLYGINNSGCGEHCTSLSHREKRQIFSSLALSKTVQNLLKNSVLHANDKVFFFMSSKPQSFLSELNGLEEDNDFELPNEELRNRRNICQLFVQVKAPSCSLLAGNATLEESKANNLKEDVNCSLTLIKTKAIDNDDLILPIKRKSILQSTDDVEDNNDKDVAEHKNGCCDAELEEVIDDGENMWFRVLQYFVRIV